MKEPLREIYERFDPEGEPPKPAWRAERSRSPASDILADLDLDLASKFLVVGTVGAGKSTELARIAEMRGSRAFMVRLDLVQHFDRVVNDPRALQRITSWEVVFLVALAVVRAARERLEYEFLAEALPELQRAWDRAAGRSEVPDARDPTIDVWKLAQSMVLVASNFGGPAVAGAVGAGVAVLNAVVDVKWKAPIGKAQRTLEDQDEAVQSLVSATNRVLSELRHQMGQPVLVVLDGLDRVEDRGAVRSLFIDSAILSHLDCDSVICGPFALRHDNDLVRVKGFEVKVLVNEPVLDQHDPRKRGDGIAFMESVYAVRTDDLPQGTVPPELVRDLAYYSGGSVRDFVKLVRSAAATALKARASSVTATHCDAALREHRLLLEAGLNTGSIEVLRRVMEDPKHRLPDDRHVQELLHSRKLLPYPDGSEWFYPHPLLLLGELLAPL